ncbi:MAG TPA: glutathione S-transferase family protein [Steroidobacteraceae bacterium]|nr:glutathione S-transferase family protein [Steroidobacteraceae bacterium]
MQLIGSPISPFVRKVLVFLNLKGLGFEIDPLVPFYGNDRFEALNPLRRIPLLIDDRVTLADSSVICQYLEERYPTPALYPQDIAARARARWLEEFADTRVGETVLVRLFFELSVKRAVFGQDPDEKLVARARDRDLPRVLDYLETQVPAEGCIFGELSIADIAIASFFRNLAYIRMPVDAARWPKTAAFIERTLALPVFVQLAEAESRLMRTRIPEQRRVLAELGWRLTTESYATDMPRLP